MASTCTLSSLNLVLQVPLQQQGMVGCLCGHTPLFLQGWGLGVASTAAGWCSTWRPTSTVDFLGVLILALVFQVFAAFGHPPLLAPQRPKFVRRSGFVFPVCTRPEGVS